MSESGNMEEDNTMQVIITSFPFYAREYISNRYNKNKKKRRCKQSVGNSSSGIALDIEKGQCHQMFMSHLLAIQILIKYKDSGIRLEYLCMPMFEEFKDTFIGNELEPTIFVGVLESQNNFCGIIHFPKKSIGIKKENEKMNETKMIIVYNTTQNEYQCYMDVCETNIENIEYIRINMHINENEKVLCPLAPKNVDIQNLCGSCALKESEISFECFKKVSRIKHKRVQKTSGVLCTENDTRKEMCSFNVRGISESVLSTSGTFVLCLNNQKVDFRGVRTILDVENDWFYVSGIPISEVYIHVYMIVLKGQIGKALYFDDGCRYLIDCIQEWCTCNLSFDDVCYSLMLSNIQWEKVFGSIFILPITKTVRESKNVNLDISRRGGVVIRFIFDNDTLWDYRKECDVVFDANRILNVIYHYLDGKHL
jgi:hypothetical protein